MLYLVARMHTRRDAARALRWACVALLLSTALVAVAYAQVVGFVATASSKGEKVPSAFTLPTQPTDVKDALDEFQRMAKHEQWEKAFKSLETITAKGATGFIDRGDGVLVPGRLVVRRLLAELPASGRSAYRLFYDAQATALWDKTQNEQEQSNLEAIVNNHLVSSVGDRAADRLGDLYFEQGEYEQAAAAWRSLLTYCPDTKIPKAQLLLKVATALVRAGRAAEFRDIEQAIVKDHATEAVVVGGKPLPAGERIALLAASAAPAESASASGTPDDFTLPTQSDPLWQFSFLSKVDPQNPQQAPFNVVDMYGRPRGNDFLIPSAVDDKRVYVNVFGVEMAFDLVSGKLVWRVGKLHTLQLQQSRGGAAPELYSIRVFGDRTMSVTREVQQNNSVASFALIVREAATGKEIYNTRRTLSSWNIQGQPWVDGDLIYVGGTRSNQSRELSLLVINAKDGKLVKNVVIGSHAADPNQNQGERVAEPTMLVHRDRVFLDTHAGALVCLQRHSGNLDWGLLYESPAPMQGYYYNYAPPSYVTSGPLRAGGLLFNKGMRSSRLVGIDTDGPTMVWNRPIDKLAAIVGADENCLYTSGEELAAFSLKTQELLWATPLPRSASWSQPIITRNRLYQFTSRGICEVDKQTGNVVRIFRGVDLDSFGGALLVSPHALVTISNLAITAYPRPSGSATTATP